MQDQQAKSADLFAHQEQVLFVTIYQKEVNWRFERDRKSSNLSGSDLSYLRQDKNTLTLFSCVRKPP